MEVLKLLQTLSEAVEKNDVAKGCLIGGATVLGAGGALYIGKKLLDKKDKDHAVNLTVG